MSSSEVAALKEQGNALYLQKRYDEAVRVYTQALALDPTNHVLYSNRCACHLRKEDDLNATVDTTRDALKCTELQPEWAKGFLRLGAAREKLGQLPEALVAFERADTLEPEQADTLLRIAALRAPGVTSAPLSISRRFAREGPAGWAFFDA